MPLESDLLSSGNIVLTGFMGTGKSSVGREVARRLDRAFVDMDVEIERRAGKSISSIFAHEGESAFRAHESELCRQLSARRGLVIATGGGALVDPENRRRMIASGPVFCLTCDLDEILRRLAPARDRPLLDVEDRREWAERLLDSRQAAYGSIPRQIDTTSLSIDQVVSQVIEGAFSICLPVRHPGGSYPIHIGHGLLRKLGQLAREMGSGERIAVITNPTVSALHLLPAIESLRRAGFAPFVCTIPDGEQHKTLDTAAGLYEQLVVGDLDRSGTVLALGGGVTCDLAGFVAATYMRGVPVIQVPTTLLAMVDASVGGKTAVDLPQGKNLVGAFKQPALVVIDPGVLRTLPAGEIASGMAELIKHGILADGDLLVELERQDLATTAPTPQVWENWIARSLQVKIDVVEGDPFERGWRAVLNLGHTTGHALEQISGFHMRHGEGVSIGTVVAARIAVQMGRADPSLPERVAAVMAAHRLPVECPPVSSERIWEAAGRDKKRRGKALRWVLPRAIGEVEIVEDVPRQVVLDVLREIGAK
jgi:3-dehydroquinate synthase